MHIRRAHAVEELNHYNLKTIHVKFPLAPQGVSVICA